MELAHGPIPLFGMALKGIESGYRQYFRCLPTELAQYQILCETFKFLEVDVLEDLSIDEIIINVKANKKSNQLDDDYYGSSKASKQLAQPRESAERVEMGYLLAAAFLFNNTELFKANLLTVMTHYNGSYLDFLDDEITDQIIPSRMFRK
jgi:hypothetical protein